MEKLLQWVLYNYPIRPKEILTLKPQRVWLIHCTQGDYILKALYFPKEETDFILGAMEHLSHRGFKNFNRIIPTKDKKNTVDSKGIRFFLSEKIPGEECDFTQEEKVRSAAEFLGEFHKAAEGYKPHNPYKPRIKWGNWHEMFREKYRDLQRFNEEAQREKNHFNSIYKRFIPYFSQEIEKAEKMLAATPYSAIYEDEKNRGGFCHHDLAHHNFIIGEEVNIIDFDYAVADIRSHDLTNFLAKVLKANHWDAESAVAAAEAYRKVNPLKEGEWDIILTFLTFPQDFWQCGLARYKEKNFSLKNQKKLERLLKQRYLRTQALKELKDIF